MNRIAVVNPDRCKPKKCSQECRKACPVNKNDQMCIEVTKKSEIAFISESLCVGCGICVKRCPYKAVRIIRIPANLDAQTTHRFGPNSFKLHRLPTPRLNRILGLVGSNGTGKSTALKILAGKLKPNLGEFENPPIWKDIIRHFRGNELQKYFQRIIEDEFKAGVKPQHVDLIRKIYDKTTSVRRVLKSLPNQSKLPDLIKKLQMKHLLKRKIHALSGGELQRFSILVLASKSFDVFIIDEPSSWLDIKQRLNASRVIREILNPDRFVIVVEHDLAVLDYMADFICCFYGDPGAYGVITAPFSVRDGINIFLAGFIPTENVRFRPYSLTFKIAQTANDDDFRVSGSTGTIGGESSTSSSSTPSEKQPPKGKPKSKPTEDDSIPKKSLSKIHWPEMTKSFDTGKGSTFSLKVEKGFFQESEIIVMLGENGTGKTTMIKMLLGKEKPDDPSIQLPEMSISYKPQTLNPKFPRTVRELIHKKIRAAFATPTFISEVVKPLQIDQLLDFEVRHLSGGERQRLAITLALGTPANLYLLDEPSTYFDSEMRIAAAKVIRRYVMNSGKTAFVVEHDFIMASYLATKVIVFEGSPGISCIAKSPTTLLKGMNSFLKSLEITFRRDPENFRPRINKFGSQLDLVQKRKGLFFYDNVDEEDSVTPM